MSKKDKKKEEKKSLYVLVQHDFRSETDIDTYIRINNQAGTGSPAGGSFFGEHIVFSPVNPTSVKVPTGYYVQPNFLLSFKNTGGVLSDFKAVIAPDEIEGAYTLNGITVVTQPVVTVSSDLKKIVIKHVVFNGAAYRNNTDTYYK